MKMSDKKFVIEYAKRIANCKKCKNKLEKGVLRIGKIVPNPFSESAGDMKQWHHANCIFETFRKARASTKIIEEPEDMEGWSLVNADDKLKIVNLIDSVGSQRGSGEKISHKKTPVKPKSISPSGEIVNNKGEKNEMGAICSGKNQVSPGNTCPNTLELEKILRTEAARENNENHVDNSFRQFRRICAQIADESSYKSKSEVLAVFFKSGSAKKTTNEECVFKGDLLLWVKMLLPSVTKRVYNIQSKQLMNAFSSVFQCSRNDMLEDLSNGDAAETVRLFFERSAVCQPTRTSTLSLATVDRLLDHLATLSSDDQRQQHFASVARHCTANDLKMYVRLIKADLRINAGAKHILDGLHCDAYAAFQTCRDLATVVQRVSSLQGSRLAVELSLMTPVLPMLAAACSSCEEAVSRCAGGFLAEIKYDGERLQLHKNGDKFEFFSRSLKPVQKHKVQHLYEFIPRAFSTADQIILDAEILLYDTVSGRPLPFGTLGIHKKASFEDATVCLFVFDCLLLNGTCLVREPLWRRRQLLSQNISEVSGRVQLSEAHQLQSAEQLQLLMDRVLCEGLEGLVLKSAEGCYEPGKRHWLKMKRDYLAGGSMADSADLVVLGAWYGTGANGGIMSVFLMGCCEDKRPECVWYTVTKVSGGLDSAALARLQNQLDMVKISRDVALLPDWLMCHRSLVPDFVVRNPRSAPVWEVIGAEFTKNNVHTAEGISIRFPRVARERPDKDWQSATSLQHLVELYESSSRRQTAGDTQFSPVKRVRIDSDVSPSDAADIDTERNSAAESGRSGGLPCFMRAVRAVVDRQLLNHAEVSRYIVAYDGLCVDSSQMDSATHLVTSSSADNGPAAEARRLGVHIVRPEWLWQSIRAGKIQQEKHFSL